MPYIQLKHIVLSTILKAILFVKIHNKNIHPNDIAFARLIQENKNSKTEKKKLNRPRALCVYFQFKLQRR